MNIFYLSKSRQLCVIYMVDKHVIKMILEYAQLLSTAHRVLDGNVENIKTNGRKYTRYVFDEADPRCVLYKSTHINHPCAIWVRESIWNYRWLYGLFTNLCDEYTYRYGKIHKCDQTLRLVLQHSPRNIPKLEMKTPLPQAMPDKYKCDDCIKAYRDYYCGEKSKFANWRGRDVPYWFV